jgi:hypothetical protein
MAGELLTSVLGSHPIGPGPNNGAPALAISDIEIHRAGNLWLGQHGGNAVAEARRRVADCQEAGDRDGADVWLRIVVAIESLSAPTGNVH